MKYEDYPDIQANDDLDVFHFVSNGVNGKIPKKVIFEATNWSGFYNLILGDVDDQGEVNDTIISNNGDRDKVLATVVKIVKVYTERFPQRFVMFSGSTAARTTLYRMAIGLNLTELEQYFEIYCYGNEGIIPFRYDAEATTFLIKRKNN